MNIKTIYLIRHGQTTGNGNHYVGWEDLPLNELGIVQAENIAQRLQEEPVSMIVSSVLQRAKATAQPLCKKKHIELLSDPRLNEINYGEYQGRLKTDLELKLRKDYRHHRLPSGESLHDVYLRVKAFWEDFRRQHNQIQQSLVIVAHYWSIRMLFGVLQGFEFDQVFMPNGYKPGNGTIYQVSYGVDAEGNIGIVNHHYVEIFNQSEPELAGQSL